MVPIPECLRLDLSAKYTVPSTFSSKYSNKYLCNVMWEVASMSRIHTSLQEGNGVLKKYSVTPILKWETM
jgi:hypothetical protein